MSVHLRTSRRIRRVTDTELQQAETYCYWHSLPLEIDAPLFGM